MRPSQNVRSLEDLYTHLPLGVYSSFRTFDHNKFLHLDHHIARTLQSFKRLHWDYHLKEDRLRRSLHQICTEYPSGEMRVRFDILAQSAHQLGADSRELLGLAPFTPLPKTLYQSGVTVDLVDDVSRDNPLIKTADFVEKRKAYAIDAPAVYEHLMVNEQGEILEGFSSNFYGVLERHLCTANEGVLEGITRKIILNLVQQIGIPLRLKPISTNQIMKLEEAAISSSSRGLLPVVNIDGNQIGNGKPGPICKRIMNAYNEYVANEIKTAI
ncbi:aminotransferase class IV [Chloroflexi bacterium TSY]|nr:aminotransferase class IV [Chloroflexi bacterium TSY]